MNDQIAAQLISQSLFEPLSEADRAALDLHLAQSPKSRQYFELSALIQNSLLDHSELDEDYAEPGLSQLARTRIAQRIDIELLRLSDELGGAQRKVAEDGDQYQGGDGIDCGGENGINRGNNDE